MFLLTTSIPTPRPDTSDIASAVDSPAAKIRLYICLSVKLSVGDTIPLSIALFKIISLGIPAPSSSISITILPASG